MEGKDVPIFKVKFGSFEIFEKIKLIQKTITSNKLEDLAVLKRSPDLLNNVKLWQDQLQLIMKHILFYGGWAILVK